MFVLGVTGRLSSQFLPNSQSLISLAYFRDSTEQVHNDVITTAAQKFEESYLIGS